MWAASRVLEKQVEPEVIPGLVFCAFSGCFSPHRTRDTRMEGNRSRTSLAPATEGSLTSWVRQRTFSIRRLPSELRTSRSMRLVKEKHSSG
jgi:hypothetical protein